MGGYMYFCHRCGMSMLRQVETRAGCFNAEANVTSLMPKLAEIRFREACGFLPCDT